MRQSSVRLGFQSVAKNKRDTNLEVVAVTPVREKDSAGKQTDTITAYAITCLANKGDHLKISCPANADVQKNVRKIQEHLDHDRIVRISFSDDDLEIKLYAFLDSNGKLISGVSGKCSAFTVIVEDDDDDDDDVLNFS